GHELGHRVRTLAQLGQDQDPARRGQSLHRVGHAFGDAGCHLAARRAAAYAVAHREAPVSMNARSLNTCSCETRPLETRPCAPRLSPAVTFVADERDA